MILEVQICTFGAEGLERVGNMTLPRVADVRYLVSVQNPDGEKLTIPPCLERPDVEIYVHGSRGLSNNRNAAIDASAADIILIADDDLHYSAKGLETVLNTFRNEPSLDFATFMYSGGDCKTYPDSGFYFGTPVPRGYYLTSFELAFRRASLPSDLRFSPRLGIGAPRFGSGEENLFMLRMERMGLKGKFVPYTIVEHPGVTTGSRKPTVPFLRSQGVWIWLRHGYIHGFPRLIIDAARRKTSYFKALYYMAEGFITARHYFTSDGADRL